MQYQAMQSNVQRDEFRIKIDIYRDWKRHFTWLGYNLIVFCHLDLDIDLDLDLDLDGVLCIVYCDLPFVICHLSFVSCSD
jgi:hypothetical protein